MEGYLNRALCAKREELLYEKKSQVLRKIDAGYCKGITKNQIGDAFIDKLIYWDSVLQGGIWMVYLLPHFDGNNGFVMVCSPCIPVTPIFFEQNKNGIGACQAVYDHVGGMPTYPHKDSLKRMMGILRSDTHKGPSLYNRQCRTSIGKSDALNIAYSVETGRFKIFTDISAEQSSQELFNLLDEMSKDQISLRACMMKHCPSGGYEHKKRITMADFMKTPYFKIHQRNVAQNSNYAVQDFCRFTKCRVPVVKDTNAPIDNDIEYYQPFRAVPSFMTHRNLLVRHKSLDHTSYHAHVLKMQRNPEMLELYKSRMVKGKRGKGGGHKGCIIYYDDTSPYEFFFKEGLPTYEGRSRWGGYVKISDQKQLMNVTMYADPRASRFFAFPTRMTPFVKKEEMKKTSPCVQRKVEEKKRMEVEGMPPKMMVSMEREEVVIVPLPKPKKMRTSKAMVIWTGKGGNIKSRIEEISLKKVEYKFADIIPGSSKETRCEQFNSYIRVQ
ncbi:MAG: hypothetical protein ACTSUE_04205 [Promethearchaeota archaeon]